MKNSESVLKEAKIIPLLQLAIKKEGGGTLGTGPHHVKLLEDKLGKKTEYGTGKEIYVMWYIIEENGIKKRYAVPLKDENGEVHYLVQRLASFQENDEVIMEYKRKGMKGYIDVQPATGIPKTSETSKEEIPVIEENEEGGYSLKEDEKQQENFTESEFDPNFPV